MDGTAYFARVVSYARKIFMKCNTERQLFKKGARDAFLCSVPRPLGELDYLRIWTDSCALGEMSAWYLMCITVHDVQVSNS
jgi:hypothetical protein